MDKKEILVVDDDIDLSFIICEMLSSYGYNATHAKSIDEAFDLLSNKTYHLLILDITFPDSTGFDFCMELRRVSNVPVIFASARTSETDKITGLDIGGDDYLSKPYSMKELLSRVNALIRRTYGINTEERIVKFGDVEVFINSRIVKKSGIEITLSLKEFDLLKYLCENINTPINKDKFLNEVWGAFSMVDPSTLTVHIRWLREKLEDNPANPKFIKTVYKIGYMLEVR